ncbi:MAG: amino acid adenylation domain-containing protein [Actinobacteria bacterium]|nr:amino acid adenylation domain-containing protein [Actinomycetota bacterium]
MPVDPVDELLADLERAGIRVWEEDGRVRFRAPTGAMTDDRRSAVAAHRDALLARLREQAAGPTVVADEAARFEPFPVTDVQAAYLLGRGSAFAYGGVGCHGYGELAFADLDPARLEKAWLVLLQRHDMLRAIVEADGSQRVPPDPPPFSPAVVDARGMGGEEGRRVVEETRALMDHRVYQAGEWPLFDLRVSRTDDGDLVHLSIDFLIADFVSIHVLLDELHAVYADPDVELPPLSITFRDYLVAERKVRTGPARERDWAYWSARLDDLPPAPELPIVVDAGAQPRFSRHALELEAEAWVGLREAAGAHGVTPSTAVLAAYAEVMARWARHPRFTIDVTLLNRLPLHPDVPRLVGDFTSVELLAVDHDAEATTATRARRLQDRLWEDLDHRLVSGVELVRELARRRGAGAALFPIVYTSAVGLGADALDHDAPAATSTFVHGISQTPQVWIDCQVVERGGGLSVNWDVRDGVFPPGVVDDMFAAFEALLRGLARDPAQWQRKEAVPLPEEQEARRRRANDTAAPRRRSLLHEAVIAQARRTPDRRAVVAGGRTLSYGDLLGRAEAVAAALRAGGCRPGDRVAVTMDKGWEQVVGVLGILLAGAAYVPIDTIQPPGRRDHILADAGVRQALVQSWGATRQALPDGVAAIAVDTVGPIVDGEPTAPIAVGPDDLAYVIYTSGSTGVPKGVMIAHEAVVNTIDDVNARFGIGQDDVVLGLANLGFDLSVYDVFGPLAVGGCLVLPDASRRGDPSHWASLIAEHGVTVWNSVPAQMQMLEHYLRSERSTALPSLRLALLSGDWIPVTLPGQVRELLPAVELVSLGGATEVSIWSIHHRIGEVPPEWASIPYGRPLANQTFHVLDDAMRPCPDWVAGELWIGGVGVAMGYLNDPTRTAERFVVHPSTGERLYRTGDLGRYLPDGEIEFLGREDFQVKIRGHRIELAEVEAALVSHPDVGRAVAVVDGDGPTERRLAAFVEVGRGATPETQSAEAVVAALAEASCAAPLPVDPDAYLAYTRRLDDVALIAMVDALQRCGVFVDPDDAPTVDELVERAGVAERHRRLVRRWLRALVEHGLVVHEPGTGRYSLGARAGASSETLASAWDDVEARRAALGVEERLVAYFRRSTEVLPELLRGEQDPLRLLFPEGGLDVSDALYRDAVVSRWSSAVAAAATRAAGLTIADRALRVLEVGAGVGGTSADVIEALADLEPDYLFSDLSPFFLNIARQRFADRWFVRFAPYDLDGDYRAQHLAPNSFDVVVAADVLHSTRHVGRTLDRLRALLAPGGWLVLVEMTREHCQIMASLELLVRVDEATGDFEDDRRGQDRTFLTRDQWLQALSEAGADTVACVPDDGVMSEVGMHVFAARFKADRRTVDVGDLVAHAAERVPEYMLPTRIEVVDDLPLSSNGKVDHAVLRAWLGTSGASAGAAPDEEPADDLERAIAAVWADVLNVEHIGRTRHFFDAGGDSLLAAQLVGRLREELPDAEAVFFDDLLRDVLEGPTVAQLAARLLERTSARASAEASSNDSSAAGERDSVAWLGEDGDGAVVVAVHDAAGTLAGWGDVVEAMLARGGAPVVGLVVDPATAAAGCGDNRTAMGRVAAAHARALDAHGVRRAVVVGRAEAGSLAVELGRNLIEAGSAVERVVVLADGPPSTVDAVRRLDLFAGDLTIVVPSGSSEHAEAWRSACLGDVQVVDLDGPPNVAVTEPCATTVAEAVLAEACGGRRPR